MSSAISPAVLISTGTDQHFYTNTFTGNKMLLRLKPNTANYQIIKKKIKEQFQKRRLSSQAIIKTSHVRNQIEEQTTDSSQNIRCSGKIAQTNDSSQNCVRNEYTRVIETLLHSFLCYQKEMEVKLHDSQSRTKTCQKKLEW